MALRATMSLLGLYQIDPTLFENMALPEGLETDVLINNMLAELAELEVIYPDPAFMKASIGFWSQKQLNVWTELYTTLLYEYNPIWNKDYTETEERDLAGTEDVTDGNSHSHDVTSTRNLANSHDVTTTRNLAHTDDSTTTESVFGFNSSAAADANKTVFDNDTSDTGTIRDAGSGSADPAGRGVPPEQLPDLADSLYGTVFYGRPVAGLYRAGSGRGHSGLPEA